MCSNFLEAQVFRESLSSLVEQTHHFWVLCAAVVTISVHFILLGETCLPETVGGGCLFHLIPSSSSSIIDGIKNSELIVTFV